MNRYPVVHRARRLDARDVAVRVYRDELRELCRRHEVDVNETAAIEILRPRHLRFTLYKRNERGNRYRDPHTGDAAQQTVDVFRVGKLPAWWTA